MSEQIVWSCPEQTDVLMFPQFFTCRHKCATGCTSHNLAVRTSFTSLFIDEWYVFLPYGLILNNAVLFPQSVFVGFFYHNKYDFHIGLRKVNKWFFTGNQACFLWGKGRLLKQVYTEQFCAFSALLFPTAFYYFAAFFSTSYSWKVRKLAV